MLRYGELADLYKYGAPRSAYGSKLTDDDLQGALEAASREADASFASRGRMPIIAVDTVTVMKVCQIAAYEAMCTAGFNPNAGSDAQYLVRAQAARDWFKQVSRGEVNPGVTFSSPDEVYSQPQIRSKPQRGW